MNAWLSNWTVYVDNLSLFYLFSVAVSFLAVFASWWFHKKETSACTDENVKEEVKTRDGQQGILGQYKKARQNAIEQKILSTFTAEQLEEERKAEKEQLAAIFQLLNEEKEKFQVTSMEELESQLRLYRH